MVYTSHSLEETRELAQRFVSYLSQHPEYHFFGLSGDLGAGKTAFTQAVAAELGITEHITSPTFIIQKRYAIAKEGFPFKTLIHIDAYRLESMKELEAIGFGRELEDKEALILLEWPEKVEGMLTKDAIIMRHAFVSPEVRTIEFPDMMAI